MRGVAIEAALAVPGVVVVVTGRDLPALAVAGPDHPLARERVYFAGQPVAAVVADSEAAAADGAAQVDLDLDSLPTVTDLFAAMQPDSPLVLDEDAEGFDDASVQGGAEGGREANEPKPHNVSTVRRDGWGGVQAGLAEADEVVEARHEMAGVHQGFLEPHAVAAAPEGSGVVVWTPTQGPFKAHDDVARLLGLPVSAVRVVPVAAATGLRVRRVPVEWSALVEGGVA